MSNNYKGFNLFQDIEDAELRTRNQAVVLANITQDHSRKGKLNNVGAALILGYFGRVEMADREIVTAKYEQQMVERGYVKRKQ